MRLHELAEELQRDLEEGKDSFIVYQQGRQWKFEKYLVNEEEKMKYMLLRHRIDNKAMIINGKKDFESYDLKYIEKKIKALRG